MERLIDRVHPDDQGLLFCQGCNEMVVPNLSVSGKHVRADCGNCGRYLKFVKQNLPPEDRAYWDARKSRND